MIAIVASVEDQLGERYVVKTPASSYRASNWDPERELSALKQLAQLAPRSREFGVIDGIAFGSCPPYLVTRYIEGRTLTSLMLDASVDQAVANHAARASGRWVAAMQDVHVAEGGGLTPDEFIESCRNSIDQILRSRRVDLNMTHIMKRVVKAVSDADESTMRHLGAAFLSHGDYVPDNILVDRKGCIYPLDPEGFGYAPLQRDLLRFRLCLQRLIGRRPWRRDALQSCWHELLAGYGAAGGNNRAAALAYCNYVLLRLGWWCQRPSRIPRNLRAVLICWDNRTWMQNWMRYIKQLDAGTADVPTLWQEVAHG